MAPEEEFAALGGWDKFPGDLPSWPTPRVVEALSTCPSIHNDGLTFWSDTLEEFDIDPDKVQSIFFNTHGDAGREVVRIALQIAESFGPVTLVDAGTNDRVQIESGMTPEDVDAGWIRPGPPPKTEPHACPKCGRKSAAQATRCMYCGEKF